MLMRWGALGAESYARWKEAADAAARRAKVECGVGEAWGADEGESGELQARVGDADGRNKERLPVALPSRAELAFPARRGPRLRLPRRCCVPYLPTLSRPLPVSRL